MWTLKKNCSNVQPPLYVIASESLVQLQYQYWFGLVPRCAPFISLSEDLSLALYSKSVKHLPCDIRVSAELLGCWKDSGVCMFCCLRAKNAAC